MDKKKDAEEKNSVPRLSEMEWEVIKPFWDDGPMAARDVYRRIPREYQWAYQTVKAMLARLVKKGVLNYDQIGNSYLYKPAFTREEITSVATKSFVQRVFDGALRPFLMQFAETASDDELKALRIELARIERENAKKKGTKP